MVVDPMDVRRQDASWGAFAVPGKNTLSIVSDSEGGITR